MILLVDANKILQLSAEGQLIIRKNVNEFEW
jgi:hypothetical protein